MPDLFQQVVQHCMTNMGSSDRNCSICGELLKPVEIEILGTKRTVGVACPCETEQLAKEEKKRSEAERIKRIQAFSDDDQMVPGATFRKEVRPSARKANVFLRDFAEDVKRWGSRGLYIYGPNGVGKSTLLSAVAVRLREQGYSVIYTTTNSLINRIANTGIKADALHAYKVADVLIVDEIGSDVPAEWRMSDLFEVLNARQDRLPILFGSNLSIKELEVKYNLKKFNFGKNENTDGFEKNRGTQLMERVFGNCIPVKVDGESRRFEKLQENVAWADRQVHNHV